MNGLRGTTHAHHGGSIPQRFTTDCRHRGGSGRSGVAQRFTPNFADVCNVSRLIADFASPDVPSVSVRPVLEAASTGISID